MKSILRSFSKKNNLQRKLEDYLIRSNSLYERDENLQKRFSSPEDYDFKKYIDTEAILYIREIQEAGIPFPPWQEMITVGGETDLRLFLSIGYACFQSVINNSHLNAGFPIKVLDFGVGCGRTMRFFYRDYKKFLCHGCDVDERAIDYLKKSIPFISAKVSGNLPPLPYTDDFFDFVYSISVFTHLDLNSFNSWIKEMSRILKKDAVLEISLHGVRAFSTIKNDAQKRSLIGINDDDFESKINSFQNDGFAWMKQPVGSKDIDISQFGITFISRERFEIISEPYFSIIDYLDGELGGWQDLVVLKKK